MKIFDKKFIFGTVIMLIVAYFSVQIAFVFYSIFWIIKAKTIKRELEAMQRWEQVEGEVVEKKVLKECSFVSFLLYRQLCMYFPYIKYKVYDKEKSIYSDSLSLFMYDYAFLYEKDVKKSLRRLSKNDHVTAYKHPTKELLLLKVEKGEYYKALLNVHYILAVFFIIAIFLTNIIQAS